MKSITKIGVLLLSVSLIASCSKGGRFFHNYDNSYLTAINGKKLIVPSPLTGEYITHYYTLPHQSKMAEISLIPPGSNLHNQEEWQPIYVSKVPANAIHKVDDGTALLIDRPLGQAWTIVGSGLAKKSFKVTRADGLKKVYYIKISNRLHKYLSKSYKINLDARGSQQTYLSLTDVQDKPVAKVEYQRIYSRLIAGMS